MTAPDALPPCLAAASAYDAGLRCPFVVDGRVTGSVALADLEALRAWPQWLAVEPGRVVLTAPSAESGAALATMHHALHDQGRLRGWRDEIFALLDPTTLTVLAPIERAAARFWGALTFGAHATGFVAGPDGRPTHLWIARRSASKATDPGLFDNLIGGGVADGQSAQQALVREGFEEAGLSPDQMRSARAATVLQMQRDVPEGLQHEWLHSFDLELPAGLQPVNQDGEVAGFTLLPVADALALAGGTGMTVDAALVTIEFACRHGLISAPAVLAAVERLRVVRPG